MVFSLIVHLTDNEMVWFLQKQKEGEIIKEAKREAVKFMKQKMLDEWRMEEVDKNG